MAITEKQQRFIEEIAKNVQKYAYVYGILVHSPIIAQAILESGWGESKLAAKYHNYFGLKCGSKWTGKSVNLTTQEEYQPGTLTTIKDNFRVYDSMEECVKGYFEFIQLQRYQNLRGITNPKEYLQTIKNDGYATSSTYVESNYRLITQYGLTKYDKEGAEMSKIEKAVQQMEAWAGDDSHGYDQTYRWGQHGDLLLIQLCVYASAAALAVSSMAFCASIPAMNEFVIIMTRVLFSSGTFARVAAIFSASLSCSAVYLLAFAMVFPPSVWCVVLLSLRLLYIASAVSVNTFLLPLRFFVDSALFLAYNPGVEVRK